MVFKSAKRNLSRDEIVEILKRNAELYKNEADFINYIVDLAIFLIENQYEKTAPGTTPPDTVKLMTTYSPLEMYKIFRKSDTTTGQYCRMCGSKLGSEHKCLICGSMTT